MKTISIPPQSEELNALLEQARQEDILVRTADGRNSYLLPSTILTRKLHGPGATCNLWLCWMNARADPNGPVGRSQTPTGAERLAVPVWSVLPVSNRANSVARSASATGKLSSTTAVAWGHGWNTSPRSAKNTSPVTAARN